MIQIIVVSTIFSLLLLGLLVWAIKRKIALRRQLETAQIATPGSAMPADANPQHLNAPPAAEPTCAEPAKPSAAPVNLGAVSSVPLPHTASDTAIPEDSVLRRHYLAMRLSEREQRARPYPTDSVLRRHYDAMQKAALETASAVRPASAAGHQPARPIPKSAQLPEDSVLKRHVLTQLLSDIQSQLPPQPTDSALKRHYAALLQTELDKRLTGGFPA
ncbi:hypothetical protein BJL95_09035 [Methylomonas sp. LWB]|uniref:hypothetical protein n=1 Tax=Methylomonas sp. LWB TaxID=1905845 RepID=UPI0008DAD4CF|nr:hypothetical protein [Methylomonas sp. LWB]OHX38434.1 hypothetical protein BJL95_09035 [Methylomonas sp. LWB]